MKTGEIRTTNPHGNLAEIQAEVLRLAAQVVEMQGSVSRLVETIRADHSGPEWEKYLELTVEEADQQPLSFFLHGRLHLIAEENLEELARELCHVGLSQDPVTVGETTETTAAEIVQESSVMASGTAFVVKRSDGLRMAVFAEPMRACLSAAVLSVIDDGFRYRLISEDCGCHVTTRDGSKILGWLLEQNQEAIEAIEVAERIVRSPMELSWFLEAADSRVLDIALRFAETRRRSFLRLHARTSEEKD